MAQDYTKILNDPEIIAWAKRFLKKRNRIEWYLNIIKEKPTLHPVEPLKHYYSLQLPEIEALEPQGTLRQMLVSFRQIESLYLQKKMEQGLVLVEKSDEILLEFSDNYAWVDLNTHYSEQEANAMGHCGNESGEEGDTILSLRLKVKKGGREFWESALTFILHEDDFLGEMKGKGNSKPHPKYHFHILELIKSPIVQGLRGGGFMPHRNFYWNDLPEAEFEAFLNNYPQKFSSFEKEFFPNRKNLDYIRELEDLDNPSMVLNWINDPKDLCFLIENSYQQVSEEACYKLNDANTVIELLEKYPKRIDWLLSEGKDFSEEDWMKIHEYGVKSKNKDIRDTVANNIKSENLWKVLEKELDIFYCSPGLIKLTLQRLNDEVSIDMAPPIIKILNGSDKRFSDVHLYDWLSLNIELFQTVFRKLSPQNKVRAAELSWNSEVLHLAINDSGLSINLKRELVKELLYEGKIFERFMTNLKNFNSPFRGLNRGLIQNSNKVAVLKMKNSFEKIEELIKHPLIQGIFSESEIKEMNTRYIFHKYEIKGDF